MAHDISKKWRSEDIKSEENLEFSSLLLSEKVLRGLNSSGFLKPSPIQLQAIPLGRCGLDMVVQAKSGTGKTCVFSVIALEGLLTDSKATQVLILAPTREIAYQIRDVITSIGSSFSNLKCNTFIGGLSLNDDKSNLKNCQIAIGTPGRIKHLIELGALKTNSIRLFVMDEADKLLDQSFIDSINWIYKKMPKSKQMLALSATYPEELANLLKNYMRNPFMVRLNADQPALIGIKQFYKTTTFHQLSHVVFQRKIDELLELLKQIHFSQCLVFTNAQTRAESLCETLIKNGWPAAYISGAQDQTKRLSAMTQLKDFQCRILVSTDLTSRGIDAENVNLILNMDVPRDLETYLHRIGRAGRFGSQGIAITLVTKGKDVEALGDIASKARLDIMSLPRELPDDLWSYIGESMQSLTEELKNDISNIKNESKTKMSSWHMPKPNSIQLVNNDFDWLNEDEYVEPFPTVNEIMSDFQSFVLSSKNLEKDPETESDGDLEPLPNSCASKAKCLKYLEENKLNFWDAVLKNYNKNVNQPVADQRSESSQLSATIMDNHTEKTTLLNKINPVPDLIVEITASKRRLLEFYQNKSKDINREEQELANPRRELQQRDRIESTDGESSTTESKLISEVEYTISSGSNSSTDDNLKTTTDDSSSEDEYFPNQSLPLELPNSLYRFPNMTNSSIQRAYHNYSQYMKQMMEWHKQQK